MFPQLRFQSSRCFVWILVCVCPSLAIAQRQIPPTGDEYAVREISRLQGIDQQELVALGSRIIFSAQRLGDFELYVSDGTDEGTRELADINPERSSHPRQLTVAGKLVFFVADDGFNGTELWCTDGTTKGTKIVKNIYPGAGGSNPRELLAVGERMFFVANDGSHGTELWLSDGTEAGTSLVLDINLGPRSSDVGRKVVHEDGVYFAATDETGGPELWRSDGTPRGTVKVIADFANGPKHPKNLEVAGGRLYFSAATLPYGRELWVSDGTADQTYQLKDLRPGVEGSSPGLMHAAGNTVYFSADDGSRGRELWSSDGTEEGTQIVADINAGQPSSNPSDYFNIGGTVLFLATDLGDRELWRAQGPDRGARLLRDINGGGDGSFRGNGFLSVIEIEGGALFWVDDGRRGREPWFSDGTNAGTEMVGDVNAFGSSRGTFENERRLGLAAVGRRVYFGADGGDGHSLWEASPRNPR